MKNAVQIMSNPELDKHAKNESLSNIRSKIDIIIDKDTKQLPSIVKQAKLLGSSLENVYLIQKYPKRKTGNMVKATKLLGASENEMRIFNQ